MSENLSIRERALRFAFRGEIQKMERAVEIFVESYRRGPAVLSAETIASNLQELDSRLLDLIMRQRGYEPIIGAGAVGKDEFTESDRLRAVYYSRYMSHNDVQTERGVQSWTDFGFGQSFTVTGTDPKGAAIWDEFIKADRNSPLLKARKTQKLSNSMIEDGEIFFVFYISGASGKSTIRRFKTDEIKEIIYKDKDQDVPLFYVRDEAGEKVYYPDWQVPKSVIEAFELPDGAILASDRNGKLDVTDGATVTQKSVTDVVILHAAFKERNGRGWPVFFSSLPWAKVYRGFLRDRATLTKSVAATVDEWIHKGGQRVQDELMGGIQSTLSATMPYDRNAPQIAGATHVHNAALEVKRRPLDTAAGDARTDGMTFLGQLSSGDGVPIHWRGRPDAVSNRATAREMERPWLESMQRYQTFWSDIFQDFYKIVVRAANSEITDFEADVFMQSPFVIYPDEAGAAITSISSAAVAGNLDANIAAESIEIIVGLVLTTYGVSNVRDIFKAAKEPAPDHPANSAGAGSAPADDEAPPSADPANPDGAAAEFARLAIAATARKAVGQYFDDNSTAAQVIEYLFSSIQELAGTEFEPVNSDYLQRLAEAAPLEK